MGLKLIGCIKKMQSRSFVCIRSYAFLFFNLVWVVVVMEAMNSYAFYVVHEVILIMITVDVAHLTAHNIYLACAGIYRDVTA